MLDIFFYLLIHFLVRFLLRITNIECTVCRFNLYGVLSLLFWRGSILCLILLVLLSLYLRIQLLNVLASCHICKVSLIRSCCLTCPIGFVSDIGCICLIRNFRLSIALTYLRHLWRWIHAGLDLLGEYYRGCSVRIQHVEGVVWYEHFLIVSVF